MAPGAISARRSPVHLGGGGGGGRASEKIPRRRRRRVRQKQQRAAVALRDAAVQKSLDADGIDLPFPPRVGRDGDDSGHRPTVDIEDRGWAFVALWSLCGGRPRRRGNTRTERGRGRRRGKGLREEDKEAKEDETDGEEDGGGEGTAAAVGAGVRLNVPDTVLFRDGLPYRWLATDDRGFLVRKPLDITFHNRLFRRRKRRGGEAAERQNRGEAAALRQQLDGIVSALVASRRALPPDGDDEGGGVTPPLCAAWYADGGAEVLGTERELWDLLESDRWREQLVGLQACVVAGVAATSTAAPNSAADGGGVAASGGVGVFPKPDAPRGYAGDSRAAAFDAMAGSIATLVERAYSFGDDDAGGDDRPAAASSLPLAVVALEAEFALDGEGVAWFCRARDVRVRYRERAASPEPPTVTDEAFRAEAVKVAEEFKGLLRLAFNRKISRQNCFSHFDAKGTGYVDLEGLRAGLSRLGIDTSLEAADILMQMIGRASSLCFRASDLVDFAKIRVEDGSDDSDGDGKRPSDFRTPVKLAEKKPKTQIARKDPAKTVGGIVGDNRRNDNWSTDITFPDDDLDGTMDAGATMVDHSLVDSDVSPSYDSGKLHSPSPLDSPLSADVLEISVTAQTQVNESPGSPASAADSAYESSPIASDSDAREREKSESVKAKIPAMHIQHGGFPPRLLPGMDGSDRASSTASDSSQKETLLRYREMMAREDEKQNRRHEIHSMRQEDKQTLAAAKFESDSDAWMVSSHRARELCSVREEKDQRELEMDAARLRARKRESVRRNASEEEKKKEGMTLLAFGEKFGAIKQLVSGSEFEEVDSVSRCLLDDAATTQREVMHTIKCQQQALDKVNLFRSQVDEAEGEFRHIGRTLRLAESSPAGIEPRLKSDEWEELQKVHDEKQARLFELKSVLAARFKDLETSNKRVQENKMIIGKKITILRETLSMITLSFESQRARLRELRQQKEDLTLSIRHTEAELSSAKERLDNLDSSKHVVKGRGRKQYVDTTLLGGLQRMTTDNFSTLYHFEVEALQKKIGECSKRLQDEGELKKHVESEVVSTGQYIAVLEGSLGRVKATVRNIEGRKMPGSDSFQAAPASGSTPEEQAHEEAEWQAMNWKINRQAYPPGFFPNPDMELGLDRQDIERILSLPEQLQLAISFLRSSTEVRAHYLLNKLSVGRGEDHFIALDRGATNMPTEATDRNAHNAYHRCHAEPPGLVVTKRICPSETDLSESRYTKFHRLVNEVLPPSAEGCINEHKSNQVVSKYDDLLLPTHDSRPVFVLSEECIGIFDTEKQLEQGEKSCHRFEIQNASEKKLVKLSVTVIYQGAFNTSGNHYKPGRLSISLGKVLEPDNFEVKGFAQHHLQEPNTQDNLGRIILEHNPDPLIESGLFELLVSAESSTHYSISVSGQAADDAKVCVRQQMFRLLEQKELISQQTKEAATIWEDMRIAERKMVVLQKLISEAEAEANRCEHDIEKCDMELEEEDDLSVGEIEQIHADIKVLEREYAHWCQLLTVRIEDRSRTKEGIRRMVESRREKILETEEVKQNVDHLQQTLPLAVVSVFDAQKASKVADICHSQTDIVEVVSKQSGSAMNHMMHLVQSTPAYRLRGLANREGTLKGLTLEEQRWVCLDRVANPAKWEWLSDDDATLNGTAVAPLRKFILPKSELERIEETPLWQLKKDDKNVKTLLLKYHDNLLRLSNIDDAFDPNLAAATRATPSNMLSAMGREWASVDQILNPTAWHWGRGTFGFGLQSPDSLSRASDSLVVTNSDMPIGRWRCPFERDVILRVWQTEEQALETSDEKRCRKLLERYNGSCADYLQTKQETVHGEEAQGSIQSTETDPVAIDVHAQCRIVLRELDKAVACRDPMMVSSVLHVIPQRFPVDALRMALETDFDRLLGQDIFDHERDQLLVIDDSDTESESSSDDDSQLSNENRQTEKRLDRLSSAAKVIMDRAKARDIALAEEMKILGFGGCLACRSNPCQWKKELDEDALQERQNELHKELLFVRKHAASATVESVVARSAIHGGDNTFRPADLLEELTSEHKELGDLIRLHRLDRELHDSYSSRHHYVEVKALHGYSTLLPTENAITALENEHNKLVASSLAHDVIDGILDWMHEGWYFGAISTESGDVHKDETIHQKRPLGTVSETVQNIAAVSERRVDKEKAAAKHEKTKKELDEAENTVKFGLFCITMMYFRAIHQVRQEKDSWSGKNDLVGYKVKGQKVSKERQIMMQEEQNKRSRQELLRQAMEKAKIGEERLLARREKARALEATRLHATYKKKSNEGQSALFLQRCYRGHLGRKAARRWAMRKAEINAQNALMNGCATAITRIWRGHDGRNRARAVRRQMAEFIVGIRAEEQKRDQMEYEKFHKNPRKMLKMRKRGH